MSGQSWWLGKRYIATLYKRCMPTQRFPGSSGSSGPPAPPGPLGSPGPGLSRLSGSSPVFRLCSVLVLSPGPPGSPGLPGPPRPPSGAQVAIWRPSGNMAQKWQSGAHVAIWRTSGNLAHRRQSGGYGAQVAIWRPIGSRVMQDLCLPVASASSADVWYAPVEHAQDQLLLRGRHTRASRHVNPRKSGRAAENPCLKEH